MKRIMDILGAGTGLILLSPLMLYLWWRIRRDMGTPVLFRQTRPGKDGVPFEMIKFRSMRDATGPDGPPPLPMRNGSPLWARNYGPAPSMSCPNCGMCSKGK